jgi:cellulose synthase/poly-beta-1,6-N-acetylglucosamine synthase-like glycosyltransferase
MFWLVLALLAFDFQNLLAWWSGYTLGPAAESSDDYTIVVPIYGAPRYFEEREHLAPLKANVLLAVDTGGAGMHAFVDELRAEGWRVHPCELERPGPPALVLAAIRSGLVRTRYVFRMDADTRPLGDLGRYVAAMQADGTDIVSVCVDACAPGLVGGLQRVEYRMAMLSRRFRPWLTSGACFGGTVPAVETVLAAHTYWFPGEDLEGGRIAKAKRMRVRHLTLRVETDAPASWRALYRQRRSWWAGGFRHVVVNLDKNLRHTPMWTLYYAALVFGGLSMKLVWHATLHWQSIAFWMVMLYALYVAVTVLSNWQTRSWWMLLLPPYSFLQTVCMPTLGLYWYVRYAIAQRSLGRYTFGYRRRRVATFTPRKDALGALFAHALGLCVEPFWRRLLKFLVRPRAWRSASWRAYLRTGWYTHTFELGEMELLAADEEDSRTRFSPERVPVQPDKTTLKHGRRAVVLGPKLGVRAWYRRARACGWPLLSAIAGALRHGR